jgi:DNA-binding CsgD family transcriptional regulator
MSVVQPLGPVDDIITHIYRGALEAKPWQSFLQALRQRMQCDCAAISLRPAVTGALPLTIWDRSEPLTEEEGKIAAREHLRLAGLDPLGNALRRSGDIYVLDEVISRRDLHESEFYHRLMKPYGVEYQLGMYFSEPNGWRCHVGLMNGPDKSNFGAAEKQFFIDFRPHLEHALKQYALLKRSELEREVYGEALNRLTIGTILLDRHGRILEANAVAKNILHRNKAIHIRNDQLRISNARSQAEFQQLIKDALRCRESRNPEPFVNILQTAASEEGSLSLLIRAIPVAGWYESDSSPSVIIYLGDLRQQPLASEEAVAQLFGLTQSEALVATLLANGYSLAEAAEKLQLTENSVRTYSKKIYAKTGIRRQAELVRVVLKSVALLAGVGQIRDDSQ